MNHLLRLSANQLMHELLSMVTQPQRDFFNRLYGSVENVPDEKIDNAIDQIERTIAKNDKKLYSELEDMDFLPVHPNSYGD